MATYRITIEMPPQTVQALAASGATLYALQAVQGAAGGRPLAWLQTNALAENVSLSWTDTYQAYLSLSQGAVTTVAAYPIEPGQTLYVTGAGGAGEVKDGGVAGAVSIVNQTTQPYTSGIALSQEESPRPLCAFPLHGGSLVLVVPIPQVFLMFSAVGGVSAANQSLGPGVLVDVADGSERVLTYDVDQGWSSGGLGWARPYPPLTDLGTLLVQPVRSGAPSMAASPAPELDAPEPAPAARTEAESVVATPEAPVEAATA